MFNGTTREETQEAQGSPTVHLRLSEIKALALMYIYGYFLFMLRYSDLEIIIMTVMINCSFQENTCQISRGIMCQG